MRVSPFETLKRAPWTKPLGPIYLSIGISIVVFIVINIQGFWDIEDLFAAGYSVGSRYGLGGVDSHQTATLVYSVAGVPVLDFGIIGGYRLPFQSGTFNTGPFWILRTLVSAEIILVATHLASMIVAALAFGVFWRQVHSRSERKTWQSAGILTLCWTALNYPTFEYLLPQDWYTVSISHQGFVTVSASLLTITLNLRSQTPSTRVIRSSIRLILLGMYFLSIAHAGHFATYFPTILTLAVLTTTLSLRSSQLNVSGFNLRSWVPELLFLMALVIRGGTLLVDLLIETGNRSEIGSDYWWATPTRSLSNLKHFLGQLISTEFQPWLLREFPSFANQFNVGPNSRLPHSAFLVVIVLIPIAVLTRHKRDGRVLFGVLALWLLNFLLMIGVIRNPIRVSVDYLYRDILLTLGMLAVGIGWHALQMRTVSLTRASISACLTVVLFVTSFSVSVNTPVFHRQVSPKTSNPYATVNALTMTDDWIGTLHDLTNSNVGVLAVVDSTFLSRWKDRGAWQGLRGFYELREAGYITLEGSPKIRDASAFTGKSLSLKQSLNAPGPEFCDYALFGFLRVTSVIASTDTRIPCYSSLLDSSIEGFSAQSIASVALPDTQNKMWILNLGEQRTIYGTKLRLDSQKAVRCGLLADSNCFDRLELRPSPHWLVSADDCRLPCVLTLSRSRSQSSEDQLIVLPLNAGNSLRVLETSNETQRVVGTTRFNGLLAIPEEPTNRKLEVTVDPDWRMWMQVVTAYSQYLVLLPLLNVLTRRWFRQRGKVLSESQHDVRTSVSFPTKP